MTAANTALNSPTAANGSRVNGDWALDLHNVSKTYRGGLFGSKNVNALRGITMQVHRGGIFGLLGPNGAGKSTLVKILMTVIRATTCQGTMLGQRVGDKSALARVGYLPEHHKFPEYLTANQVLDYFGALANVPRVDRRKRSGELLELVGLTNWRDHKVKGFSKGMRQRLGIANALMNDPELVVLDEPTDGVDPVGRRDIRNILTTLRDQGRTVCLNSHLLSELEMVCDHVAILVQGTVAAQGTIDELTRNSRRYEIVVRGEAPAWAESMGLSSQAGTTTTTSANGSTTLVRSGDVPDDVQTAIDRLRSEGRVIVSVTPVRESLEDLFMRAVTDEKTGKTLKPGADMSR